jgi:hypothetical protein
MPPVQLFTSLQVPLAVPVHVPLAASAGLDRAAIATDKTRIATARKNMLPLIVRSLFSVIQVRLYGKTDYGVMPRQTRKRRREYV